MQDVYCRPPEEEAFHSALELRKAHPTLHFRDFEWISDPNMRLVIDDISTRHVEPQVEAAVRTFEISCKGGIKVYSMRDLVQSLYFEMAPLLESCDPHSTLLIFPGEGAETVKAAMSHGITNRFPSIIVEVHRIRDGQTGLIRGVDLPNVREVFDNVDTKRLIENVVIIDDVIDTGNTISTTRNAVNWKHARWFAAATIVYSPLIYPDRAGFPSSVEGYKRIFAAEVVQGVKNPIPLNSLTSFVEGGEKTERLVRKCLDLFVPKEEQEVFLNALLQLRKILMYN